MAAKAGKKPLGDVTASAAAAPLVVMGAAKPTAAMGGAGAGPSAAAGASSKTLEQIYQKVSQREHIMLRPDSYVGSVQAHLCYMWVWDAERKRIVARSITYVPALYKIYDEILVNAADNKQRDKSMTMLKVTVDSATNMISVWNNGALRGGRRGDGGARSQWQLRAAPVWPCLDPVSNPLTPFVRLAPRQLSSTSPPPPTHHPQARRSPWRCTRSTRCTSPR